jgi:hypothetical protein
MGKSRGRGGGRGRGRGKPVAGKDVEGSSDEEEDQRKGGEVMLIIIMVEVRLSFGVGILGERADLKNGS